MKTILSNMTKVNMIDFFEAMFQTEKDLGEVCNKSLSAEEVEQLAQAFEDFGKNRAELLRNSIKK